MFERIEFIGKPFGFPFELGKTLLPKFVGKSEFGIAGFCGTIEFELAPFPSAPFEGKLYGSRGFAFPLPKFWSAGLDGPEPEFDDGKIAFSPDWSKFAGFGMSCTSSERSSAATPNDETAMMEQVKVRATNVLAAIFVID